MKRFFTLLLGAIAVWSLSAQTYIWKDGKVLDIITNGEVRLDKIPEENFATPADVQLLINSLYHLFGEQNSYRSRLACCFQGYNTDIEYNGRSSGQNDYSLYTITPDNTELGTDGGKNPWNYLAYIVYNASIIVDGITTYCDTTYSTFACYLGQALVFRAFALSEMVKLWGDVPSLWKMEGSQMAPWQPKQDRNLLYERMRADLKRAANLLPWSENMPNVAISNEYKYPTTAVVNYSMPAYMEEHSAPNYTGVPSKAAALGLLARIDLNYAGYALRPNTLGLPADGYAVQLNVKDAAKRQELYREALEACAQVIKKEGSYKLLPDYEQIFKNICADVTDYHYSEVIWEIPFENGTRGQVLNRNGLYCNRTSFDVLKHTTSSSKVNGNARIVPTLYFDFESGDVRRNVTVAPFEWYYSTISNNSNWEKKFPGAEENEKVLYQKTVNINKFSLAKYRVEWMVRDHSSDDDGINFPIIRYADVLLMFCEASLGGITNDVPQNTTGLSPQSMFDQIRARAGVTSKTLTMENLMNERKFEFAGEYLRKFDLIRWGKLRSALENARQRIKDLDQHVGEYANTTDSLYIKYRYAGDEYSKNGARCYVLEAVSNTWPADYNPEQGWYRTSVFTSNGTRMLDESTYFLYDYNHPEYLDSRQLWPIFTNNFVGKDGYLWNDYNY